MNIITGYHGRKHIPTSLSHNPHAPTGHDNVHGVLFQTLLVLLAIIPCVLILAKGLSDNFITVEPC